MANDRRMGGSLVARAIVLLLILTARWLFLLGPHNTPARRAFQYVAM